MKKTLLSLLAVVGLGFAASAAEVNFDFVTNDYDLGERGATAYVVTPATVKEGDVTLSLDKTSGNGFRLWKDGLRVYKTGDGNATISVAAPEAVTAIDLSVATEFASVSVDGTALTFDGASKTYSWTGNAAAPVITITQSKGNYALTTLRVTYGSSEVPVEPSIATSLNEDFSNGIPATWTNVKLAGDKEWYTTSFNGTYYAAATGYKGTEPPFDFWLISPAVDLDKAAEKVLTFRTQVNGYNSTTSEFHAFILDSNDPATATRTELKPELAVAPGSGYSSWVESGDLDLSAFKGTVYVAFQFYAEPDANYATWCVTDVKLNAENKPVDPVDPVEPTEVVTKSVAETIALASGTEFTTDFALTVGWVSFKNIFACDENGDFIQVYNENTLQVGDVIPAGMKATYTLFKGTTPEIEKVTVFPEATAGTFTPAVVPANRISTKLVNSVITVKDVVLAEASPATKDNFTGVSDGVELSLRNNYTLESVEAGTYDITVVVTVYNDAPSLYVTNYAVSTGVEGINADNNGPVEFFNLQGVRVANPDNGLFIRRQGNKVSKVYIR